MITICKNISDKGFQSILVQILPEMSNIFTESITMDHNVYLRRVVKNHFTEHDPVEVKTKCEELTKAFEEEREKEVTNSSIIHMIL